mmetsp:Transcript_1228/g.2773  ORF Transcript_1228/g.2773 Transcript_1228/m.2773 type:complete len:300 (+) Transcript_1228:599-1498(+)
MEPSLHFTNLPLDVHLGLLFSSSMLSPVSISFSRRHLKTAWPSSYSFWGLSGSHGLCSKATNFGTLKTAAFAVAEGAGVSGRINFSTLSPFTSTRFFGWSLRCRGASCTAGASTSSSSSPKRSSMRCAFSAGLSSSESAPNKSSILCVSSFSAGFSSSESAPNRSLMLASGFAGGAGGGAAKSSSSSSSSSSMMRRRAFGASGAGSGTGAAGATTSSSPLDSPNRSPIVVLASAMAALGVSVRSRGLVRSRKAAAVCAQQRLESCWDGRGAGCRACSGLISVRTERVRQQSVLCDLWRP